MVRDNNFKIKGINLIQKMMIMILNVEYHINQIINLIFLIMIKNY